MTVRSISEQPRLISPISLSEPSTNDEQITFDDFWTLYPRRIAKLKARIAWDRIIPERHAEILLALVEWRKVWKDKELEFLPYPASWLNGERWEDELPQCSTWNNSSHMPASLPEQPERTIMPQKVRDLLAKLRKNG